mgnify:CR=1 FL=1
MVAVSLKKKKKKEKKKKKKKTTTTTITKGKSYFSTDKNKANDRLCVESDAYSIRGAGKHCVCVHELH